MLEFLPVIHRHAPSVVQVWKGGKHVAMGTIVGTEGLILTKASELGDKKGIQVILADRTTLSAKIRRTNSANDLAIIEVSRTDLPAVNFATPQPLPGAFLVTPDATGHVMALGTYSAAPRALSGQQQGFLGVKPQPHAKEF